MQQVLMLLQNLWSQSIKKIEEEIKKVLWKSKNTSDSQTKGESELKRLNELIYFINWKSWQARA